MRPIVLALALLAPLAACETAEQKDAYDNLWCADQGIYQGDARYEECRYVARTSHVPLTPSPAQDKEKQACTGGFFQCYDK